MNVRTTVIWLLLGLFPLSGTGSPGSTPDSGIVDLENRPIEDRVFMSVNYDLAPHGVLAVLWDPSVGELPPDPFVGIARCAEVHEGILGMGGDGCEASAASPVTVPAPGVIALLVLCIAVVGRRRVS